MKSNGILKGLKYFFYIQFGEEKVNLLECHKLIALNFINYRGMNIFATLKKIAFGTLITKIR